MKQTFRKIAMLLIIALSSFTLNAQEPFGKYFNNYTEKEYEIQIALKERGNFRLYIDAFSLDKLAKTGGIMLDEGELQNFTTSLQEAKAKYQEWTKTAKDNNVKEVTKSINIKCKVGGYFEYSDWHFQFSVKLDFEFKVLESSNQLKHLLIVRTNELKSSKNEFIKVDGFAIVFENPTEIDTLLDSIKIDKVKEFQSKPKTKDLFKD